MLYKCNDDKTSSTKKKIIKHDDVNRFIENADHIYSDAFVNALQTAKDLVNSKVCDKILLTSNIATRYIHIVSDHCHDVLLQDRNDDTDDDTDDVAAIGTINDMMTLFEIPREIWTKNTIYLLSIILLSAQYDCDYIRSLCISLTNIVGKDAFFKIVRDVASQSKKIRYTKVFELQPNVQKFINASKKADAIRHAIATNEKTLKKQKQIDSICTKLTMQMNQNKDDDHLDEEVEWDVLYAWREQMTGKKMAKLI